MTYLDVDDYQATPRSTDRDELAEEQAIAAWWLKLQPTQ